MLIHEASHKPFTKMRRTMRRVSCFVLVLAFVVFAAFLPRAEAKDEKPVIHAGYRTLSSSLPSERLMLHRGVWYPTLRRPGNVKVNDWAFRGARNAPIMEGPWPVVVLSHDVTGNAWAHHEIAAALARRGFIVAAPTHDHDNGEDMSMLFSDRELPLRATQLRAALDMVLEHKHLASQADASRVGYLGFGLTAPAGLLLAGASLDADGWPDFVQERRNSSPLSPWLQPYVAQRMDGLVEAMRHRAEERREKTAMLERASDARSRIFQRLEDSVERVHQRQMRIAKTGDIPQPPAVLPLLPPLSHDHAVTDSRFRAFALVSPGYAMLFSRKGLAAVRTPVFLIGAGQDSFVLPVEQAERLAAQLPVRPDYLLLPEADMVSFHSRGPAGDTARPLGGVFDRKGTNLVLLTMLLDSLQEFFQKSFTR